MMRRHWKSVLVACTSGVLFVGAVVLLAVSVTRTGVSSAHGGGHSAHSVVLKSAPNARLRTTAKSKPK